jgi:hypothetical protein
MEKSKPAKRQKSKRQLIALQVEEYIARYHPHMRDVVVDVSPCGTFASVREAPKSHRES